MAQTQHFDVDCRTLGEATSREHKSALGQFLTPSGIANFMASLFTKFESDSCHLLDPGAGLGALSAAFISRWIEGGIGAKHLEVTAFEIDERLRTRLSETAMHRWQNEGLTFRAIGADFVEQASLSLLGFGRSNLKFTHAILNPPYKKIATDSTHRQYLRKAGIETVNLYSGFLGLTIRLVEAGGEIVAIIPRSFCNGPYYKPFREILLQETAIQRIHLFHSRNSAFKDDAVLQENVILLLKKHEAQGEVTISTSTDDTFADLASFRTSFDAIVRPGDKDRFIHIPASPGQSEIELSPAIAYSLEEIGIQVSTGPVVDFRVKRHLRSMPEEGSVPLIYPAHFSAQLVVWPRLDHKKPNALMLHKETEKSLYPSGFYTVVRRFSSKEEVRRIVAHTVSPQEFDSSALAFENHLNVFHENKHGLDENLARGLTSFLNSSAVDAHFRRFNGHTQVNATDLRSMQYPSREVLIKLGRWAKDRKPNQGDLDSEVRKIA